jgi:ubiquinone/menaquinone biosynthesis C-methylase UbiE
VSHVEKRSTRCDFWSDPEAYELEERARPDEMLMQRAAAEIAVKYLDGVPGATALDLCCGTGISMESLVAHPNVILVVGVDISLRYLEYARKVYANSRLAPILIHGDAVLAPLPRERWDIVMLASAYHHIEDDRKIQFLRRVHSLIGACGRAVIAENILPIYDINDRQDYNRAVSDFYSEVLSTARRHNPHLPNHVADLIQRVAQYGVDGAHEYKVSMAILHEHLAEAQLQVVEQRTVWPEDGSLLGGNGGNYVFLVRSA